MANTMTVDDWLDRRLKYLQKIADLEAAVADTMRQTSEYRLEAASIKESLKPHAATLAMATSTGRGGVKPDADWEAVQKAKEVADVDVEAIEDLEALAMLNADVQHAMVALDRLLNYTREGLSEARLSAPSPEHFPKTALTRSRPTTPKAGGRSGARSQSPTHSGMPLYSHSEILSFSLRQEGDDLRSSEEQLAAELQRITAAREAEFAALETARAEAVAAAEAEGLPPPPPSPSLAAGLPGSGFSAGSRSRPTSTGAKSRVVSSRLGLSSSSASGGLKSPAGGVSRPGSAASPMPRLSRTPGRPGGLVPPSPGGTRPSGVLGSSGLGGGGGTAAPPAPAAAEAAQQPTPKPAGVLAARMSPPGAMRRPGQALIAPSPVKR